MQLPATIPVEKLLKPSSEYRPDLVEKYEDLYRGGEQFRRRVDKYLIKRRIEEKQDASGIGGDAHYQERRKRAWYANRTGGTIDWLVAQATLAEPRIVVDGEASDEARLYWEGLNEDADGLGTPFAAVVRQAMAAMMRHQRSYFRADFPADLALPSDPTTLDARILYLDPVSVDDWEMSGGELVWARTHTMAPIRETDYLAGGDRVRHYWAYFDAASIVVYSAVAEGGSWIGPDGRTTGPDKAVAIQIQNLTHDYGRLPIYDVRAGASQWVLDRVADVAVGLFNTETDLTFVLSQGAYPVPVLNLANADRINWLASSPLGAVVLEPGESFEFAAPPAQIYEPLFKSVDRGKASFFEVLQTLAKEAASIPQAGRLSGEAVTAMREPMQALLSSFCWPVREAAERLIADLKEYRGDDCEVKVVGMDRWQADMDGLREQVENIAPPKADDDGVEMPVAEDGAEAPEIPEAQTAEALNGAQVTSASDIVVKVAAGELPRSSGVAMLVAFFHLTSDQAEAIIGPAGTEAFRIAPPAPTKPKAIKTRTDGDSIVIEEE